MVHRKKAQAHAITEQMRKSHPKEYFHAVKRITKWSRNSIMALQFARTVQHDEPKSFL